MESTVRRMRVNRGLLGMLVLCLLALAAIAAPMTAAAAECPNEALRTGPGAFLPDCRAYEQASPVDKNGAGVGGIHGFMRVAPGGSAVTFFNSAGNGFPSLVGGNQTYGTYLAARDGESWSTERLMVPESYGRGLAGVGTNWLGSTSDLRYTLVEAENPAYPSAEFGRGLYLIETADGNTSDQNITTIVPREANQVERPYAFDGASQDGSRIFFETEAALTPDAEGFGDNLYMWSRATGAVTLVGLLPGSEGGREPEAGSFGGAYEWYESSEPFVGGALQGLGVEALHAISPTGDQIYFTAGETGQLYLRRGLTGSSPETVRVSQSAADAPVEAPQPAAFQEATPSGSFAFFLSSQKLTANATTGPADEGKDLYRWDAGSGQLVDIAPDVTDDAGARVQGVVGVAANGRSGYFVAEGDLATGAASGEQNLYRFAEAGNGFAVTYIAALTTEARREGDTQNYSPRVYREPPSLAELANDRTKSARTLSDGAELLFSSSKPLTGYENVAGKNSSETNICTSGPERNRCGEVFLYSASTERVICISCDPSGAPPLGPGRLDSVYFNVGFIPNGFPNVALPRNLSADGDHIFFESPDPLVPRDTNAAGGCPSANEVNAPEKGLDCFDVYEWEAAGTPGGSCHAVESNGGCLYLLSTGQSAGSSYFLDASEDGSEAFIATTSRLVPSDRDSVYDAYDVKSDGGLASQFQVDRLPCEGEACLDPPNVSPATAPTASSQVEGPGNAKQHKKKQHKKKQHKKKQHKKKQHKKKQHKKKSRSGHHDRSGNTGSRGGK